MISCTLLIIGFSIAGKKQIPTLDKMALCNCNLEWPSRILFFILIIFMILGQAPATMITVVPGESIQAAIDNAGSSDIIKVNSGTYKENVDINKKLTLVGIDAGEGAPIINSAIIEADGCELKGFKIDDPSGFGISVISNNNSIADNSVIACGAGIFLKNCHGNVISHNDASIVCQGLMSLFRGDGIHLLNSYNNIINNNTAEGGYIGIFLDSSDHNRLESNHVNNNTNGIGLLTSVGNIIKNNCLRENSDDGLSILKFSNNNTIENNNVENSGYHGIYLQDSSHNIIYLNNFIGNNENAGLKDVRSKGSSNQWHSSELIKYSFENRSITSFLGNYWSDYNGKDSDGNGIGDNPCEFNGIQDDYPLMERGNDLLKSNSF